MMRALHIALLICSVYAAASACKDGDLEIVKGTRCRRYAQCENGSWHLKECKFGQIFDSKALKCAVGRCNDGTTCSEGRTYSYLGSNNLYYRCINGRLSVQVCGAGEVFDANLQDCRFDGAFQDGGLSRAKRNADEACVEGSKRRDGKTCKDYLECVNGQEVKKSCTDCMNFDDTTQSCRFVFVSPCPYTPEPSPTTTPVAPTEPTTEPTTAPTEPTTEPTTAPTEPTTPPTEPTETPEPDTKTDAPTTVPIDTTTPEPETTTQTEAPTTAGPCKEGDKVGLVDPECKAYEECKKGVWVKDSCGWWRKFDAIKKECEYSFLHKITCAS